METVKTMLLIVTALSSLSMAIGCTQLAHHAKTDNANKDGAKIARLRVGFSAAMALACALGLLLVTANIILTWWMLLASFAVGAALSVVFIHTVGTPRWHTHPKIIKHFLAPTTGLLGLSSLFLGFGIILIDAFCLGGIQCGLVVSAFYAFGLFFIAWGEYCTRKAQKAKMEEGEASSDANQTIAK